MLHAARVLGSVPSCSVCGRPRTKVCDNVIDRGGYKQACGRSLCDLCAVVIAYNVDNCPECAGAKGRAFYA